MSEQKKFKMELSFERSFLPTRSSNIKIIATISGSIDEKLFRNAVGKLGSKHLYLRSKVVMRADGTAYLTTQGGKEPEAMIVTGSSDTDVLDAIYQADKKPSNWETDPTSRFILIKGVNGADVIVAYLHHVIADGRSTAFVLKHLLEFIADSDKPVAELIPISLVENAPADVLVPQVQKAYAEKINSDWAEEKVTFGVDDFVKVAQQKYAVGSDVYFDQSLTQSETAALRNES